MILYQCIKDQDLHYPSFMMQIHHGPLLGQHPFVHFHVYYVSILQYYFILIILPPVRLDVVYNY